MTIRRLAIVAATVAIAGCGSHTTRSAGTTTRTPTRTTTRALASRAYQLYTHCGIEWAKINGTFWQARHPLSDGNGNPPSGWGNPYQKGTLVFVGATTARFESAPGNVTFERTSLKQPPFICS
jgi:hypothetical protein